MFGGFTNLEIENFESLVKYRARQFLKTRLTFFEDLDYWINMFQKQDMEFPEHLEYVINIFQPNMKSQFCIEYGISMIQKHEIQFSY